MNENLDEFNTSDLLKSTEEIKKQIEEIDKRINFIDKSIQRPYNLLGIKDGLNTLKAKLNDDKDITYISPINEIAECVETFNKTDDFIKKLESLINKFLLQVYLKLEIETLISQDNKDIKYLLKFYNIKKKKLLTFNELTTPEKVFFVIVLYLSIMMMLSINHLIFSNMLLPKIYNKRGSIFRTIKKILPVFKRDLSLKNFNLVFILSDLEIKEQLKDLTVINIEE